MGWNFQGIRQLACADSADGARLRPHTKPLFRLRRTASRPNADPVDEVGIKVDIAAGHETLNEVQAALDAFWSLHEEVPSRVRMEIEIAACEIAANIVEHCCPVGLWMELHIRLNEVQIEFTDTGAPIAVDLDSVRMPDEMAERGRGLAMAQATLRLLSYFRDEVGNHWRLVSKAFPSNANPCLDKLNRTGFRAHSVTGVPPFQRLHVQRSRPPRIRPVVYARGGA